MTARRTTLDLERLMASGDTAEAQLAELRQEARFAGPIGFVVLRLHEEVAQATERAWLDLRRLGIDPDGPLWGPGVRRLPRDDRDVSDPQ